TRSTRDWSSDVCSSDLKTARRAALRAALASRHAAGTLLVVDDLRLPEPKTKRMIECLRGLGLEGASVLIVLARADAAIQRAARKIGRASCRERGEGCEE